MLPFVFNAEAKPTDQPEAYYDPANQQRQMEEYYQQYERKQGNSSIYRDTVGLQGGPTKGSAADVMRQQLAETELAIARMKEEKVIHQHQVQHQYQQQMMNPPPTQQYYAQNTEAQAQMSQHEYYPQEYTQIPMPIVGEAVRQSSSERKRSRSPSWARDARRSRSRDKKRSRSRSRDRERRDRDRDRKRSRSRDRHSRRRRDHRSRSYSPSNNGSHSSRSHRRRRSRSASREKGRSRHDEWHPGVPCNKLAVLNLPNDVDNATITFALGKGGYLPQDVRTMTKFDKLSKQIRTFAFVEFSDVSIAERWMEENQGYLILDDGRQVIVEYAKGDPQLGQGNKGDDWICAHCSMNNFVKRQNCFKCEISKEQSMELEKQGVHMVGVAPCDTILIRGLPDNCQTEHIFDSLTKLVPLNSISLAKMSDSKRFAYIQMKSSDEATMLLNMTYKAQLRILNKDVQVSYCRDSMTRLIHQQMTVLTQGSGHANVPTQGNLTGAEIAAAALSKAQAVRQASRQVGQMMTVPPTAAGPAVGFHQPPPGQLPNFSMPPPNMAHMMNVPPPTLVATAGAPPATSQYPYQTPPVTQQQQQPPSAANEVRNGIIGITPTPRGVFPRYVPPNHTNLVPDAASGYYIDMVTNFFYDTKTGYYYNNETKNWCTYDATYETYFPVEESTASAAVATEASAEKEPEAKEEPEVKKKKKEDEEPKTAADLAKHMAKWAKKQEKKVQLSLKSNQKTTLEMKNVFQGEKKKSNTINPIVLGDDEEEEEQMGNVEINPHTGKVKGHGIRSQISPDHEGSSRSSSKKDASFMEMREIMERALIDESKKMCLLCKRAFPSTDVLKKHVDKSELHKTNLEQKRREWGKEYAAQETQEAEEREAEGFGGSSSGGPANMVYRDRAKERRKQYGIDATGYAFDINSRGGAARHEDKIRQESEEAASRPLNDNNIGSRLLKNMGWKEGQGVGKNAQGIVNPIQAERFVQGAGLGSSGSRIRGGVEASHKEKTKQALFSRYHDQ